MLNQKPVGVRIFAALLCSELATLLPNSLITDYDVRLMVDNLVFAISFILTLILFYRGSRISFLDVLISSIVFLAFSIISGLAGLFAVSWSMLLAIVLTYPISSIGYYPNGPDAWFVDAAALWAFATLGVINLSSIVAIIIQRAVGLSDGDDIRAR
jgi:hypothetical protein